MVVLPDHGAGCRIIAYSLPRWRVERPSRSFLKFAVDAQARNVSGQVRRRAYSLRIAGGCTVVRNKSRRCDLAKVDVQILALNRPNIAQRPFQPRAHDPT